MPKLVDGEQIKGLLSIYWTCTKGFKIFPAVRVANGSAEVEEIHGSMDSKVAKTKLLRPSDGYHSPSLAAAVVADLETDFPNTR